MPTIPANMNRYPYIPAGDLYSVAGWIIQGAADDAHDFISHDETTDTWRIWRNTGDSSEELETLTEGHTSALDAIRDYGIHRHLWGDEYFRHLPPI